MLGFVGQFQHSLDAKSRLILPVKFRAEFERGGHLSPNTEGCVALWTPGEFSRQMDERLQQSRAGGSLERQQVRYWSANSSDVEFDKQGRFALPPSTRDYGQLAGDVLIVGAIDHVELWNPATYAEKVNAAEEIFKQGSGLVTGVPQQYRPRTTRSLAIVTIKRESSSALSPVVSIERLRMAPDTYHEPVLASEIVELFASLDAGVVIDATLGGGGHAEAILSAAPVIRILGIDRDPEARAAATTRLTPFASRVRIVDATFGDIASVLAANQDFIGGDTVVGVLMDLGVSSHQLDESARGFSFRSDAPLDMRMDPTKGETAAQLLSHLDQHALARLLRDNGESRFAGSIAKSVLERQPQTTFELTEAVERAVPMAARRRGHVATRAFQALRIAVNDETEQLETGLVAALDGVGIGGVVAVISYHSGEDRLVKSFFAEQQSGGCTCLPDLPCVCGAVARVKVFKASAQLATANEIAKNPRSRSARLRIARKLTL